MILTKVNAPYRRASINLLMISTLLATRGVVIRSGDLTRRIPKPSLLLRSVGISFLYPTFSVAITQSRSNLNGNTAVTRSQRGLVTTAASTITTTNTKYLYSIISANMSSSATATSTGAFRIEKDTMGEVQGKLTYEYISILTLTLN